MPNFIRRKISPSKSLGEILKSERKKREITLEAAEEETKVRAKYLKALEEGRYEALPGNVYALGFLGKYVDLLELDKDELTRQFKLERGESSHHSHFLFNRRIKEPIIFLTSKTLGILAIAVVLISIIGYIAYSVRSLTAPPNLQISSPSADQIITANTVDIVGKTDESASLTINNETILLDGNGNFTEPVKLNPGLNTFEVKAVSHLQKETTKQIKIYAQI